MFVLTVTKFRYYFRIVVHCAFGLGPAQHTHTRTSWREDIRQNKQRKTSIFEDNGGSFSLSDATSLPRALMIFFFSILLLLANLAHKLNYRLCLTY